MVTRARRRQQRESQHERQPPTPADARDRADGDRREQRESTRRDVRLGQRDRTPRGVVIRQGGLNRNQQEIAQQPHEKRARNCPHRRGRECEQRGPSRHADAAAPERGAASPPSCEAVAHGSHGHSAERKGAEMQAREEVIQVQFAADKGHQRAKHRFEEGKIAQHPVGCPGQSHADKALRGAVIF